MKLRASRDTLLRPLRVVTGVVERRPTLPVLANLHVEATESALTVRGTDLEVEIVAKIEEGVDIDSAGSTTVPAHKLAESGSRCRRTPASTSHWRTDVRS